MTTLTLTRKEATTPLIAAALLFATGTVVLETVFKVPVKIPGHRALPGALALLLFAEAFAPLLLCAFAAVVPTLLLAMGTGRPIAFAVWGVAAALVVLSSHRKWRSTWLWFLGLGLVFGLLRYLSLLPGFHKTPELIRLAGHLGFGLLGGGLAGGVTRLLAPRRAD